MDNSIEKTLRKYREQFTRDEQELMLFFFRNSHSAQNQIQAIERDGPWYDKAMLRLYYFAQSYLFSAERFGRGIIRRKIRYATGK